ncbi:DUF3263 domain-containing protein [Tessaracoccus massiliensis]|uniref:DUF3263 domain-containing protein n=1 Tax=Tessaracoccus massiliensis TaxID=1522311 RepID=UPI00058C1A2C|nr:DUF3263 domain-containing protein [Tessaracoccus massiliensis]
MSEALHVQAPVELTEREAAILDFEDSWFTAAVPKEQAIMEHFSLSSVRYYQQLNALIDTQAALEYRPLLVKRLRRMRSQRHAARSARRLHA